MGRPRGCGHEVLVDHRLVDGDVRVLGTRGADFACAGRICRDDAAADHVRRREDLGGVADGGDGLVRLGELPDAIDDLLVEPQVLGRPAAGDEQRIVISETDVVEGRVEREVVPALLGVGLVAFEIVDGSPDLVALLLARADRFHRVADRLQRLERHHDLVVLPVVAHQHQDSLGHGLLRGSLPGSRLYSRARTESTSDSRAHATISSTSASSAWAVTSGPAPGPRTTSGCRW